MNKPISGMLRDKWILGAIDVYEDSSHSAVRRHDVCSGDDKADADAAWNALSNQALGNKDHGLAGFERMPLRIFSIGRLGSYTVMTTIYIIYNIYVVLLYYIYILYNLILHYRYIPICLFDHATPNHALPGEANC